MLPSYFYIDVHVICLKIKTNKPKNMKIITDLLPSDSYTPTLHLVAYSVNQKGRSEPTVLEDIAINEAEKRTGMYIDSHLYTFILFYSMV